LDSFREKSNQFVMRITGKKNILLLAIGTLLAACVKEKNFPVEPVIEFKSYNIISLDSADCYIKFTDGDGDIGVLDGDTIPDLSMKYLYKDTSGKFIPYDMLPNTTAFDTLFYKFRIPDVTPDGQFKALEGEIRTKLRQSPLYFPSHQFVKFEIQIKDRAGHKSNIVTTSEIAVPQ
jgi:hypothetical protein